MTTPFDRSSAWLTALAGTAVLWSVLILLTPGWRQAATSVAPAGPQTLLVGLVYLTGARICHQRPERSFHRQGHPLPVCGRCTGLYLSGTLGLVIGLARRPRRQSGWSPPFVNRRWPTPFDPRLGWLLLAGMPTLATWAGEMAGLWNPGTLGRAAAAVPLGLAVGVLITTRR